MPEKPKLLPTGAAPVWPLTSTHPLVGRCFHIFGADKRVERQGCVVAPVGEGLFLVQYFEWMMGEANTLEIVQVADMVSRSPSSRGPGYWQFYEDHEHMNHWYENHPNVRP